ncbi:MAG: hypothetical protein WAV11_03310 [Minisyncoccia bacterium]
MNVSHLKWQALEHEHKIRSVDWFWAVGLITLFIVIFAILIDNYLFAVFIFLAGLILIFRGNVKPRMINCEITNRGIILGEHLLPYDNLEAFFVEIDHTENQKHKILIRSQKLLSPLIIVPADGQDPELIHLSLLKKLKEDKMEESVWVKLAEILGF